MRVALAAQSPEEAIEIQAEEADDGLDLGRIDRQVWRQRALDGGMPVVRPAGSRLRLVVICLMRCRAHAQGLPRRRRTKDPATAAESSPHLG